MKITRADHTSFSVSNLDRSLQFYVGLLGCETLWKREEIANPYFRAIVGLPDAVVRGACLRIPGSEHLLELFEYVTPRGTAADLRTNNPGTSHISLCVEDLFSVYEELKGKGARFRSPPVYIDEGPSEGGYALYMLDPDGITVELFQPPRRQVLS